MGIEDNEKTSTRGNRNYELSGKIMLCTVILLFFAVIVILCLHSYWFCDRRGRRIRRLGSHRHVLPLSSATGVTPSSQGLSLSVLQAIPSFVYSSSKSHSPLECAVCLSQFEDNEKGRVLPKCCHVFHVDCIDVWFLSHSNCPLCRAPVCPENLAKLPREISAETAARQSEQPGTELELSPRLCQSDHEGEDIEKGCSSTCSSSSSSLSPVSSPRKPMELVGITVEAPRGFNRTSFSSLQRTKFNSPGRLNRTRSI